MDKELLKASDVAQILNVSLAKAYRLIQHGKIPFVRVDSLVRVKRADLEHYIEENGILNDSPDLHKT